MKELIDLMKDILMLKREDNSMVGLSGFKRTAKPVLKTAKKKVNKEMKLSDLMRRA